MKLSLLSDIISMNFLNDKKDNVNLLRERQNHSITKKLVGQASETCLEGQD